MTTTYTFLALYTKNKISASPLSLPTVSVIDSNNTLLVNNANSIKLTNLNGNYYYSYTGDDGLICWAVFHTNDTTVDQQDILSYTPTTVISNQVWDEVLTGATHNVPTSSGRRLRQLASAIIYDAIVTGATENTIGLDLGAASNNGAYDPAAVTITTGNGIGQSRLIYQYDGATRTAVVDRDWKTMPQVGDECIISTNPGYEYKNYCKILQAFKEHIMTKKKLNIKIFCVHRIHQ